jgi:excisionase family DNA binding protein
MLAPSRLRMRPPGMPTGRFPAVLDVPLTAHFLTVSADTVYDLFQRGDLPGWKVGRTWLITKAAVLRWLEASTTQSTAAAPGRRARPRHCQRGPERAARRRAHRHGTHSPSAPAR